MDIVLGIQTADAVILVTSKALSRGVSVLKADDKKVIQCNEHTAMAFTGEPGDTSNFVDYIKANVQLYGFRNNSELSTKAVASFSRQALANSLRSRKPYQVNILVAGFDDNRPQLHWIDYLGTNVELPYAAHGYAMYYVLSTLDRWWKKTMTLAEGLELARKCINELTTRLPIDFKGCDVHVVDKSGVRQYQAAEALSGGETSVQSQQPSSVNV